MYTGLHAIRTLFYLIYTQVFNALPWALDASKNSKCARSVHHCHGQTTVTRHLERNHPAETMQCVKTKHITSVPYIGQKGQGLINWS